MLFSWNNSNSFYWKTEMDQTVWAPFLVPNFDCEPWKQTSHNPHDLTGCTVWELWSNSTTHWTRRLELVCGQNARFRFLTQYSSISSSFQHERNIFHRDIKADNILFTQRTPTHAQSCTNSSYLPSSSPAAHMNRISGMKSNGYRRHIRKWFHNKSRNAVSVYPRSRSETRADSSTRRSVTPSETQLTRIKPSKTPLNRSRWDSSHANADFGAYGDRCNTQDISESPRWRGVNWQFYLVWVILLHRTYECI